MRDLFFRGPVPYTSSPYRADSVEERMNRKDLAKAIANRTNTTSAQALHMLDAFEAVVTDAVATGEVVQIMGFGTFSTSRRRARNGHNPGTGEEIQVPAVTTVRFSAGSRFKLAVNRERT